MFKPNRFKQFTCGFETYKGATELHDSSETFSTFTSKLAGGTYSKIIRYCGYNICHCIEIAHSNMNPISNFKRNLKMGLTLILM